VLCPETYEGDQPPGWVYLIAYHSPQPVLDITKIRHWSHDKVLCPKHAKMLDDLLFPERPAVDEAPAGSA
jgi:hypothetical protein